MVEKKSCTTCSVVKTLEEFDTDKRVRDGRRSSCKECVYLAHVERSYNISRGVYAALLERSGGCCELCQKPFTARPCVDHDHACCSTSAQSCGMCVRGLLCRSCNFIVGTIETNRDLIEKLELYTKGRTT